MHNTDIDACLHILDQFPNLIWCSGTDGKHSFFNKSWLKFTGRSIEQELGDGWIQGIHPDDIEACITTYTNAFKEQKTFEMEYRLRHCSGEYRWIRDCGSPIYGQDGSFEGFIGSCYDMHEEKSLNDRLNALSQEYETIFNTTQDPMALMDVDDMENFTFRRASKAHERYTGLACESIKGLSPREVFGEKAGSLLEAGYRRCLKEKSVVSIEEKVNIGSDEIIWHTVLSPIVKSGKVVNIVVARRDITELKLAEAALREKEEQYRSFIENNHSVMLLIEPKTGRIVSANPAACKFYGYTVDEITNMKISQINILPEEQLKKELELSRSEKGRQSFFSHRLAS